MRIVIMLGLILIAGLAQASSFEEDIEAARNSIRTLNSEILRRQTVVSDSNQKIGQNLVDLDNARKALKQMEPEATLISKVESAKKELAILRAERDRVAAEIAPAEAPLVSKIDRLNVEISNVRDNIARAESQVSQNDSEISHIKNRLAALGSEQSLLTRVDQLRRDQQSLRIQLARLEQDAQSQERQIDSEIMRLDNQRRTLQFEIDRMRSEISDIDRQINDIRLIANQIRELDRHNTQLKGQIPTIDAELAQLDAQISAATDPVVIQQLQMRRNQKQSEKLDLQRRISANDDQLVRLQSQLDTGNAQIPGLQARRDELSRGISLAQTKCDQMETTISQLERRKRDLWIPVERIRQQLDNVTENLAEAQNDLAEHRQLSARLPVLYDNNQQLEIYISQLRREESALMAERAPIVTQLAEVRRPLVAAQAKVDASAVRLNTAQANLQSLYDTKDLIVKLEKLNVDLQALINKMGIEIAELRSRIVEIEKQILALEQEAAFKGVYIAMGELSPVDQEKVTQLGLKTLNLSRGLSPDQVLKRTLKVVHISANSIVAPLNLQDQQTLLSYMRAGGLLVIWGRVEKLLPPKQKPEVAVTEAVRETINIESKKAIDIPGLLGTGFLKGIKLQAQGPMAGFMLDNLKLKNKVIAILEDSNKKKTIGTHTIAETNNKILPSRTLVISVDFGRVNAQDMDLITNGLCNKIRTDNPAEVSSRKVCNI